MRNRTRIIALAAAMLGLCLAGRPVALAGLPQQAPRAHAVPPPEARIDINHATVEDLLKVPGMTSSWAGRIVRFRPYHAKNDLLERGVVTSQVYARIKDYVIAHRIRQ